MWIVEITREDGEVIKHSFATHYYAFETFDSYVKLGLKVKYPYYI